VHSDVPCLYPLIIFLLEKTGAQYDENQFCLQDVVTMKNLVLQLYSIYS
jgi:hypothetical protein